MLTFSFSHEALEKALHEDELLRHLAPNRWMAMTVLSPQQQADQPGLPPAPAGHAWPRAHAKDW